MWGPPQHTKHHIDKAYLCHLSTPARVGHVAEICLISLVLAGLSVFATLLDCCPVTRNCVSACMC
jgi:hypothetical protein